MAALVERVAALEKRLDHKRNRITAIEVDIGQVKTSIAAIDATIKTSSANTKWGVMLGIGILNTITVIVIKLLT